MLFPWKQDKEDICQFRISKFIIQGSQVLRYLERCYPQVLRERMKDRGINFTTKLCKTRQETKMHLQKEKAVSVGSQMGEDRPVSNDQN